MLNGPLQEHRAHPPGKPAHPIRVTQAQGFQQRSSTPKILHLSPTHNITVMAPCRIKWQPEKHWKTSGQVHSPSKLLNQPYWRIPHWKYGGLNSCISHLRCFSCSPSSLHRNIFSLWPLLNLALQDSMKGDKWHYTTRKGHGYQTKQLKHSLVSAAVQWSELQLLTDAEAVPKALNYSHPHMSCNNFILEPRFTWGRQSWSLLLSEFSLLRSS